MNKEKNGLTIFLSKNLEMYQKYRNEIIEGKNNNINGFKNEFLEGLDYYEKSLKENEEITNENQDKILKIIIMGLSNKKAKNIIEISLEAIEIIAVNNYFSNEVMGKNIKNLSEKLLYIYKNYSYSSTIINQILKLIEILIESQSFILKNESLYNIIMFLLINIFEIHSSEEKLTTYQLRKTSKLVLNKCIERLISQSNIINGAFENINFIKYYANYHLNEKLYNNYINQLMKYYIDKILDNKLNNKDNKKNEKGIDKGKYNWCFNCRNEANYYSDDLGLPICSKKCEYIITYTEKLLNIKIYYNFENYSVFEDYINVIKIISYNTLFYLNFYLFNAKISINYQKKMDELNEKLNFFVEIIYILLSQPIVKDNAHNKFILDLIKEYIFPFLIEISIFYKKTNNLNGYQNNIKMFELIITELDHWYIENLKIEIYTFTETIIFPFLHKSIYNDDFLKDQTNHLNHLSIQNYLIEFLNSNLRDFLFELHMNFDSQFYFKNIFINIIKYLTNILYDTFDKKLNNEPDIDSDAIKKIKSNSLSFILDLLVHIEETANELNSKENQNENKINNKKINDIIKLKNILDESVEIFCVNPSNTINFFIKSGILPQIKDFIKYKEIYIKDYMNISDNKDIVENDSNKEKIYRYKYNLPYFPKLFLNEKNLLEEKDINEIFYVFFRKNFSMSLNYDDFTAYILAFFIRLNFTKIIENNKYIISNFFTSFSSQSIKVLNHYIRSFNFKNYNILEALHLLFNYLPLINNQQILETIISIFSNKFIKDNFNIEEESSLNNCMNEYFIKLSKMIIEISYSLLKEKNIQNQIKMKKLKTINEYLNIFRKDFKYYKEEEKLQIMNYSYIYDIYNLTLTNPLNLYSYPNTNLLMERNGIIKSNNNLYGLFPIEFFKMKLMDSINKNNLYISKRDMNKESLRNIIRSSWEYFFGIFSKQLAYYNDSEDIIKGINNMLLMANISGIMELYSISDTFIISIVNMTGLNESLYKKLNNKNILVLRYLFPFIQQKGKYIYSSWYSIFSIISRIYQLRQCKPVMIYKLLQIKNLDIKTFFNYFEHNKNQISLIDVEQIYTESKNFSLEVLKKFVIDLIKITDEEIKLLKNADKENDEDIFFSFNKLIYVFNINRDRLKNGDIKMLKDFFNKLSNENPNEDILINKINETFIIEDE